MNTPIDSKTQLCQWLRWHVHKNISLHRCFYAHCQFFIGVRIGRAFASKILALFMRLWQKPLRHNQQCDMIAVEYFPYYLNLFSWSSATRPTVQWNSLKKLCKLIQNWFWFRTLILKTLWFNLVKQVLFVITMVDKIYLECSENKFLSCKSKLIFCGRQVAWLASPGFYLKIVFF